MNTSNFTITLLLVVPLVSGCPGDKGNSPRAPEHASEGVVPGSYEDWCGEHEVPESKCTRCDSSLVAAFKATNDWCGEHGLPESQCLQCNPSLVITRPPKPGGK
ncbi:RND transporter [Myxococcota bacterium]|nr:RND transporter [Myxococcota bacterium]